MDNDITLDATTLADASDYELLKEIAARGLATELVDATDAELLDEVRSRGVILPEDILNQANWVKLYHLLQTGQEAGALQMVREIAQNITGRVLP